MADLAQPAETAALEAPTAPRTRKRVLAIVNVQGKASADAGPDGIHGKVAAAFAAAGVDATIELVVGSELSPAVQTALGPRRAGEGFAFDALAIGGGDGTISTAAGHLAGTGIPLGVLPLGTLNHFARDLGIPPVIELAAIIIAQGHARDVDVGDIDGRVFVNNSSIGIYPYMIEAREQGRRDFGLGKWGAMALAFAGMLRRFPLHHLHIRTEQEMRPRRTLCAFIGNNLYALDASAFGTRERLDRGELCLYIARSGSRLAFIALIAKAIVGHLMPARDFELVRAEEIEVHARSRRLRVAADGELEKRVPPLRYRIRKRALRVIVPSVATP